MLVGSVTKPEEIEKIGPLVDVVEVRLDFFDLVKKPRFPCIFTFRKKDQGGIRNIQEKQRLLEIEKYLELEPEYLDIEADTDPAFIERIAKKFPQVRLIGSYHNFEKTPEDLEAVLLQMKNPHFAIYKMALQANSTLDMLRLMLFARDSKERLAVMSMGQFGKPSRVLAKIMGSLLDYTSFDEEPNLQRYDVRTLLETFRYRKLNRQTQVYALIGNPIENSNGHVYHNAHFKKNAVYIKMIVNPEEIHEVFFLLKQLPFRGLSVTIPLKEHVQPEMDEITPLATKIGAINTVIFRKGRLIGTNTDAPGALNALEKHIMVSGKKMAVLGAGGAARAIIYEAKKRGASVVIFNRTPEKAKLLAKEFGCQGFGLNELQNHLYDILVNTIPTTLGRIFQIQPRTTVMDIVTFPKETPFLKEAKKNGCFCVYGEEMFVEQALLQQQEWNGD